MRRACADWHGVATTAFCRRPEEPDAALVVGFNASDFWNGTSLTVPGQGGQEVLLRSPSYTSAPADGAAYPLVTRQNWAIGCLPSVQNASGEGFVAVSPQGVRYRFDWMATRLQPNVKKSGGSLGRQDMYLMATLVTDRFGNWVRYTYDPANPLLLTRIESSDGRVITITNASGRASSASDGTRSFVYSYGSLGELSAVTQPDGSRWTFDLTPMVPAYLPNLGESSPPAIRPVTSMPYPDGNGSSTRRAPLGPSPPSSGSSAVPTSTACAGTRPAAAR